MARRCCRAFHLEEAVSSEEKDAPIEIEPSETPKEESPYVLVPRKATESLEKSVAREFYD